MKSSWPVRLHLARENGFLNAAGPDNLSLIRAYGRWCWRLRIPVIWFERMSPRSRYGRLHLEMFTTANRLTRRGQRALSALAKGTISAQAAFWDGIPLSALGALARQVYRTATEAGNFRTDPAGACRKRAQPGRTQSAAA